MAEINFVGCGGEENTLVHAARQPASPSRRELIYKQQFLTQRQHKEGFGQLIEDLLDGGIGFWMDSEQFLGTRNMVPDDGNPNNMRDEARLVWF